MKVKQKLENIYCEVCKTMTNQNKFNFVKNHLHKIHNITNDEYKEKYLGIKPVVGIKCLECDEQTDYIGWVGFIRFHLKKYHPNITNKEYYDKHLKKENEDICPICGNTLKFHNISQGYKVRTCSLKCSSALTNKLFFEKTGYNSPSSTPEAMQKTKNTKFDRYGDENYVNPNKTKVTKLERYGDENYVNKEKIKQTNLKRYGGVAPACNKSVQLKMKQTTLERHGHENYRNVKQAKETNLERYGCVTPLQNEHVKEKIKQTCLERYGCENPLQSEDVKEKIKQTCLERYGCEYASQNEHVKEKIKQTCLERYGCEYVFQNEDIQLKCIETWINKYGCDHPMKAKVIINKAKQTNLEKYGCENPLQNEYVKEKIKQTNLRIYGCENPMQNEDVKAKTMKTNMLLYGVEHTFQYEAFKIKARKTTLKRYGCEYASQNEDVKKQIVKTNLIRYGCKSPMQDPTVFDRSVKNRRNWKEYQLPSGKIIKVQGYEPFALDLLCEIYNEDDIETSRKYVPNIWYFDKDNINRRYYPDIFIKSENLILEVKSTYFLNLEYDINMLKQQACLEAGYKFEFLVFDQKGNLIIIK